LKSGKGNHYKDFFVNKGAEEYIVTPTHAIYSLPNGEQIRIEIKVK
jgi:hypothetical protein